MVATPIDIIRASGVKEPLFYLKVSSDPQCLNISLIGNVFIRKGTCIAYSRDF